MNFFQAQDDASDVSEHSTKTEDQNKLISPDLSNVTSRTNKGNSESEAPDIGTVENQKEDSDGKSETDVLTSPQKEGKIVFFFCLKFYSL